MRTPQDIAIAVVDCWINDSEGNYVQGDPEKAAADILTTWRDECVAEKQASEGYEFGWFPKHKYQSLVFYVKNPNGGMNVGLFELPDNPESRAILAALLSRAPLAESDIPRAIPEGAIDYQRWTASLTARARAAEAERDRLRIDRDDLRANVAAMAAIIDKLREENEALRDRLFALGAMNDAPCFACGYNGPGYYNPEKHPCAERHHRLYEKGGKS